MLDNRDYMRRRPWYELKGSVTLLIIALNVIVFAVQNVGSLPFPAYDYFALSVEGLKRGHVWQLITFQFLHLPLSQGGIFQLLGNLYAIRLLGPAVEEKIGRIGFIKVYLLSGTLGGLLQVIGGYLVPQHFGQAVVGASAGAFGILAVFATLFPAKRLHIFFLPFAIRADAALALAVTATLIGLFLPFGHIAHCAHLGGVFWGFMFARKFARANHVRNNFAIGAEHSLKLKITPVSE